MFTCSRTVITNLLGAASILLTKLLLFQFQIRLFVGFNFKIKDLFSMLRFSLIKSIAIVPKKGSSEVRICIDFRKVNQVAKMDSYPLSRIEDLID